MRDPAHYEQAREIYRARARRRGPLAWLWRACAAACERSRCEALLRGYRLGRSPGWIAPVAVREVERDG